MASLGSWLGITEGSSDGARVVSLGENVSPASNGAREGKSVGDTVVSVGEPVGALVASVGDTVVSVGLIVCPGTVGALDGASLVALGSCEGINDGTPVGDCVESLGENVSPRASGERDGTFVGEAVVSVGERVGATVASVGDKVLSVGLRVWPVLVGDLDGARVESLGSCEGVCDGCSLGETLLVVGAADVSVGVNVG